MPWSRQKSANTSRRNALPCPCRSREAGVDHRACFAHQKRYALLPPALRSPPRERRSRLRRRVRRESVPVRSGVTVSGTPVFTGDLASCFLSYPCHLRSFVPVGTLFGGDAAVRGPDRPVLSLLRPRFGRLFPSGSASHFARPLVYGRSLSSGWSLKRISGQSVPVPLSAVCRSREWSGLLDPDGRFPVGTDFRSVLR